jgi:hypothetical protein
MRWPWWDRRRPSPQRPAVNPRRQELETAKEILAEVFDARPSDVEDMILARLEERSWSEEGRWPERFCTGE